MFQAIIVPEWRLEWLGDARYYGRRWCAHVGPWIIFIWQLSAEEMNAYDPAKP